jgi:hypothetical protein
VTSEPGSGTDLGEDLAEVGDVYGNGIQFIAASQDILQHGVLVFAERRGVAG